MMVNFILELIDFNEGIDYSVVTRIVLLYLVLLWIFVSIWVFNDAKYRFNNIFVAVILAFLNLILSFPFLLIYLLIRPSHREDWDDASEGGINIPVANFTGKDGVVISLQLKIDTKKILEEKIDYNLDVVLNKEGDESNSGQIEIKSTSEETELFSDSNLNNKPVKTKPRIIITKLRMLFVGIKEKFVKNKNGESTQEIELYEHSYESNSENQHKKKKKNKKGKKKKK